MVVIDRPDVFKKNKDRPRKPYRIKRGLTWQVHPGGAVTIYDKHGSELFTLASYEWTRVRPG